MYNLHFLKIKHLSCITYIYVYSLEPYFNDSHELSNLALHDFFHFLLSGSQLFIAPSLWIPFVMAGSSLEELSVPDTAENEGLALASKRSKLYSHENVSSQLFDPYGPSVISSLPLDQLWEATAGGGKLSLIHI